MNSDFLSYVIPILGSSLSVLLSVYSLFSAKKLFKDISKTAFSIKKAKQYRQRADLNIEKLQLELEEMNKLILQLEELEKQELDIKGSETDDQQVVLLKKISSLLEKSAISKSEAIETSGEKS